MTARERRDHPGPPPTDLELPPGFAPPDWEAPFDLAAHLRRVPDDATVKGMFLTSVVDDVHARCGSRLTEERYTAFRDYPLSRLLELMVEGAGRVYPRRPVRDGMRRLARPSFSVFDSSLVGRAVFAVSRHDPHNVFRIGSRAWRHATNLAKVESEKLDETAVVLRVRDFHFTDAVAVGIAEGVLEACGRPGSVAVRMESPSAGDFLVRWM